MPADANCSSGDEERPATRAVVDRVVDGRTAVLLLEPDREEIHLPVEQLPEGSGDGTWLLLEADADPPRVLGIDHEHTEARRSEVADRMQRLRRDRRGGRFDRAD